MNAMYGYVLFNIKTDDFFPSFSSVSNNVFLNGGKTVILTKEDIRKIKIGYYGTLYNSIIDVQENLLVAPLEMGYVPNFTKAFKL